MAYPATRWTLIERALREGDDASLRELMREYRDPIEGSLRSRLSARGLATQATLEDFVGWLFAGDRQRRLRRENPDGRVLRFRGFVGNWVRRYVEEQVRQARLPERPLSPELEATLPSDDEGDTTFDRLLAERVLREALDEIRAADHEVWRGILLHFHGFSWRQAEVALDSRRDLRYRSGRALRALREFVTGYALRELSDDAAGAAEEWQQLSPYFAPALRDYVAEHGVQELRACVASEVDEVQEAARLALASLAPSGQS